MARNGKYDLIKKNFKKIEQLLQAGHTEKKVAQSIGIAYSTWNKYKTEHEEFSELIIKSREEPVDNLVAQMYQSGMGFTKTIKRAMKLKEELFDPVTGKKSCSREKIAFYEEEIYIPPNFQAAKFLIMNWGKDLKYCSEPRMMELREKELQHKIDMAENENW